MVWTAKKIKPYHKQVDLTLSSGRKIKCDENISNLVRELNEAGLITIWSCEGGKMLCTEKFIKKFSSKTHFSKAQLSLDMRSISSVQINKDWLEIEWIYKNPNKTFKEIQRLTRLRNELRQKNSNEYGFKER